MNQLFTSFADFKQRYPIRPQDKRMLLGSGSYGKVVKVEDQLETEWVAIKISEVKDTDSRSLLEEVKLAQGIPRQANIARYDACYRFETDTSVSDFAVMKYYSDGNLAQLLRNEQLSSTQIYDLTKGILLGLQHLHGNRVVHRDFKPANILISRDNDGRLVPKIADFGLSKLVHEHEVDNSDFDLNDGRGTPSYKAPEQIDGSRVSFNLDLWAFGVILYEMLVGEKPFRADQPTDSDPVARRAVELKIMSVELPARLGQIAQPYQRIIRRCLVRDIHQRARKVAELLSLLDNVPQAIIDSQLTVDQHATEFTDLYVPDRSPPPEPATDVYSPDLIRVLPPVFTGVTVASAKTTNQPFVPIRFSPPTNVPDDPAYPDEAVPFSPDVPERKSRAKGWRFAGMAAAVVAGIGLYAGLWGGKPAPKAVSLVDADLQTKQVILPAATSGGLPPITTGTLPGSADLNRGLMINVPFGNGSLLDLSGANNHARSVGKPAFVTDRKGVPNSAILLNGKGDYFFFNDHVTLRPDTLSISLWIRVNELKARMTLYNKSRFADSYGEQYSSLVKPAYKGKGLTINTDIKQGVPCGVNGHWQTFPVTSSIPIVNTWHHIVFTYAGRTARMYLDGLLISERTDLPFTTIDECAGGDLKFGAQIKEYPQYFNGAIDDVRLYNRALTSDDVKALNAL